MGKNTKIIATIVPNGAYYKKRTPELNADGTATGKNIYQDITLRFSLLLTPRLPDSGLLIDYFEVLHWPDFVEVFTNNKLLSVSLAKKIMDGDRPVIGKRKSLEARPYHIKALPNAKDEDNKPLTLNPEDYEKYKDSIWGKIFNGLTPVSGWILDEYNPDNVLPVFNVALLKQNIEEALEEIEYRESLEAGHPDRIEKYETLEKEFNDFKIVPFNTEFSAVAPELTIANLTSYESDIEGVENDALKSMYQVVLNDWFEFLEDEKTRNALEKIKLSELKDLADNSDINAITTLLASSYWQRQRKPLVNISQYLTKPEQIENEDELKERNKENQEFHKKFSILADNPALLRLTGWIFDFEVDTGLDSTQMSEFDLITLNDLSGFDPKTGNSSDKELQKMAQFFNEIEFKCPWTAVEFSDHFHLSEETIDQCTFGLRYRNGTLKIEHGFINPQKWDFAANKAVVGGDGETVKILKASQDNGMRNTERLNGVEEGVEVEELTISDGIGISIGQNNEKFKENLNESAARNEIIVDDIDGMIIYGQSLDVGYRIDVLKGDGSEFKDEWYKSLCQRTVAYHIDKNPDKEKKKSWGDNKFLIELKDEGWVQESPQVMEEGGLEVVDEIARWNNWSLVCPHIGEADGRFKQDPDNRFFNDLELNKLIPQPGSLPKLRFGETYRFSVSIVDICGNGLTYTDRLKYIKDLKKDIDNEDTEGYNRIYPGEKLDDYLTPAFTYRRKEHVSQLELFLNKTPDQYCKDVVQQNQPVKEDLRTMVIRSFAENGELECDEESIRWVGPPRVAYEFFEKHGKIDDQLKTDKEEIISNIREIFDHDQFNKETSIRLKEGADIMYFPDPVVDRFIALGYKNDAGNITPKIIVNQGNSEGEKDPTKPVKITIKTDQLGDSNKIRDKFESYLLHNDWTEFGKFEIADAITNNLDEGFNQFQVLLLDEQQLNQGLSRVVALYPLVKDKETDSDVTRYFEEKDGYRYESTPTWVHQIHAIQKPLLTEKEAFYDTNGSKFKEELDTLIIDSLDRKSEQTNLMVKLKLDAFPLFTVEHYTLQVVYEDYKINLDQDEGYEVFKEEKQIVLAPLEADKLINEGVKEKGFNIPSGFLNAEFTDTKHRTVNFCLKASSRFKDYFANNSKEEDYFNVVANVPEEKLVLDSYYETWKGKKIKTKYMSLPSSKRPDMPIIDRITPVFDWSNSTKQVKVREHKKFRVYFKNTFYSSGLGEKIMLFVMAPTENTDGTPNYKETIPDVLEETVCHFGMDPTTGKKVDMGSSALGHQWDAFFDADRFKKVVVRDENGEVVKDDQDLPVMEKEEIAISKLMTVEEDSLILKDEKLHGVMFDLKYSKELKQWYCDIEFNYEDQLYMPFVKFAMATYQENALQSDLIDMRFSNVISTSFAQIMPYREVTFGKNNNKKRTIKVKGRNGGSAKTREESKFYGFDGQNKLFKFDRKEKAFYKIGETINRGDAITFDNKVDLPLSVEEYELLIYQFEATVEGEGTMKLVEDNEHGRYIKATDGTYKPGEGTPRYSTVDQYLLDHNNPRINPNFRLVFQCVFD